VGHASSLCPQPLRNDRFLSLCFLKIKDENWQGSFPGDLIPDSRFSIWTCTPQLHTSQISLKQIVGNHSCGKTGVVQDDPPAFATTNFVEVTPPSSPNVFVKQVDENW